MRLVDAVKDGAIVWKARHQVREAICSSARTPEDLATAGHDRAYRPKSVRIQTFRFRPLTDPVACANLISRHVG